VKFILQHPPNTEEASTKLRAEQPQQCWSPRGIFLGEEINRTKCK